MSQPTLPTEGSAVFPTSETRVSNTIYEDFINSVKGSEMVTQLEAKPKRPNAEDGVVAILLSSMMQSIVKNWTSKYPTPRERRSKNVSEDYASAQEQEEEEEREQKEGGGGFGSRSVLTTQSHRVENKEDLFTVSTTQMSPDNSGRSRSVRPTTLNALMSLNTLLDDNFLKILQTTSGEAGKPVEEEDLSARLNILKEMMTKEELFGWEFLDPELEFVITFNQGNRYEGKLLNCRMHGGGKFYWADGSVYEGEFRMGKMTGQGRLYWPDGSWYEGEMCKGFRHGRGLYVSPPTFYAGYWRCGCRHGVGAMFYDHFDTGRHYYNGQWAGDKKHGTGLRCYPSGAMYSGQWRSGMRHGLGTMVWTNSDVYSGNFRWGEMHGYGEYTWDTFHDQQFVVPQENCYYGDWVRNIRDGYGTLETTTGVVVRGSWRKGRKHGAATVICSNGNFLFSHELFCEDNLYLPTECEEDSLMNASLQSLYQLPVSAASHDINLNYYVNRMMDYIEECNSFGKPFKAVSSDTAKVDNKRTFSFNRTVEPEIVKFDCREEETYVRNVLMQFQSTLRVIYNTYAQMCCEVKPTFPTVLMRIMWWQLLRDCDVHSRGISLADFDIFIANNKACLIQWIHFPFERIQFWQFLHCLIEVSWQLYGKKGSGTPWVKGVIASGLHRLITGDLMPNAGSHKGKALVEYKDLICLDSLYWYYRGIGEPLSAREFLKRAVEPPESDETDDKSKDDFKVYPEHQIRGKNVIGVGGKLSYFPGEEPLMTKEKYQEFDQSHPRNISFLSSLGLESILECILQVCPNISSGGMLINMDYKLVFLEFYEILLLCTCKKANINILERKRKEAEEAEEATKSASLQNDTEEVPQPPEPEEDKTNTQPKKTSASKKPKKKK